MEAPLEEAFKAEPEKEEVAEEEEQTP